MRTVEQKHIKHEAQHLPNIHGHFDRLRWVFISRSVCSGWQNHAHADAEALPWKNHCESCSSSSRSPAALAAGGQCPGPRGHQAGLRDQEGRQMPATGTLPGKRLASKANLSLPSKFPKSRPSYTTSKIECVPSRQRARSGRSRDERGRRRERAQWKPHPWAARPPSVGTERSHALPLGPGRHS